MQGRLQGGYTRYPKREGDDLDPNRADCVLRHLTAPFLLHSKPTSKIRRLPFFAGCFHDVNRKWHPTGVAYPLLPDGSRMLPIRLEVTGSESVAKTRGDLCSGLEKRCIQWVPRNETTSHAPVIYLPSPD